MIRKILVASLFGVMTLGASPAMSADVTLRLGHAVFESHPFHDAAQRFSEAVARHSNGEVEVKVFPSRQLGDSKELMEGVRMGTVDLAVNDVALNFTAAPALAALQLPWVIEDYAQLAAALQTPEALALTKDLDADGVVTLGFYEGGQRNYLTINRRLEKVEDFKGLKTRVAPVRLHLDIARALGMNPTPMAYGEVYTALETGTLDAVETNLTSVYSEKYNEIAHELLRTRHHFWPAMLLMNERKFKSLKPEHQAALRAAVAETVLPQIMAVAAYEDELQNKLTAAGVTFTDPSPAMQAQMVQAVTPLVNSYTSKDPAIAAFVEKARTLKQ